MTVQNVYMNVWNHVIFECQCIWVSNRNWFLRSLIVGLLILFITLVRVLIFLSSLLWCEFIGKDDPRKTQTLILYEQKLKIN